MFLVPEQGANNFYTLTNIALKRYQTLLKKKIFKFLFFKTFFWGASFQNKKK